MNGNINIRKRNIFLSVAVIFIGLLLVGGTYAVLTLTLPVIVTNGVYNYTLECFDIDYDAGNSIIGTLFPSRVSSGGLSGSLSVGINENCDVLGVGDLNLVVHSNSDKNGILTQVVDAHCEDSSTLETLTSYTDSSSCTSAGGVWVDNGTALKYAVFVGSNTTPSSVGYINVVGDTINIYNDFSVSALEQYTVKVWLDGNLSDNTYANLSFSGEITTSVTQLEQT